MYVLLHPTPPSQFTINLMYSSTDLLLRRILLGIDPLPQGFLGFEVSLHPVHLEHSMEILGVPIDVLQVYPRFPGLYPSQSSSILPGIHFFV